jgi:putative flippase GtrA
LTPRFFRFLLTGGIAALVNIGSRYALNFVMSFGLAMLIAYLFGMITAYVLARLFVFEGSGRSRASELKRFAIVNLFSLSVVWGISVGLAKLVFPAIGFSWHARDIAHAAGVFAPAVLSYVGHRSYTFAKIPIDNGG